MNRISAKLLSVLAIFLFVAVIPIAVLATNENVSVVSKLNDETKAEYIIYIKDYTDKTFKYAFTTNANPQEMDLSFIKSNPDLGEKSKQVACLDAGRYEELRKQIANISRELGTIEISDCENASKLSRIVKELSELNI